MLNLKSLTPVIILCIICLVMTGLVSLTFEATREERLRQEELAANENRQAMYPDAATFDVMAPVDGETWPDGLTEWTQALDASGQTIGHIIVGAKRGYAGFVPVMVAISPDGVVMSIRMLANEETPGLGKKVEQNSFAAQFSDQTADQLFSIEKNPVDAHVVDAISGATISSRAVTDAVNIAIQFFQTLEQEDR